VRRLWLTVWLMACQGGDDARRAPSAALVRVATVEAGTLTESWNTVGEVRALEQASLAVGADGPVARVLVREGDRVADGDLLLELDLSLARAEAGVAQAAVDEAAAELSRLEDALARRAQVGEKVLGREALQEATQAVVAQRARVDGRRAEASRAAASLEQQRLRAPFDGVVTERTADPGDWVRTGETLLSVVSTDRAEVRVRVPEAVAQHLSTGDRVTIGDQSVSVLAVVPTLDTTTRTALVRIQAPQQAVVGEAIDVTVPIEWSDHGVKVPRDALIADPEQARLVRVEDGTARVVPVEVLVSTRTEALVQGEGLSVGDVVVVRGNERVRPGQPVRIENNDGT
jgi:RND family efflux transporter MFP subunit